MIESLSSIYERYTYPQTIINCVRSHVPHSSRNEHDMNSTTNVPKELISNERKRGYTPSIDSTHLRNILFGCC